MDYGRQTILKDVSFELLQSHINLVKQKYTYTSLKSFFLLKKLLSTIFTAITITVFNQFVASSTFFTFPQWMEVVTAWLEFSTWIKKTHKLHMVSQAPLIKSPLVPIALISPGLLLSVTRPKVPTKDITKDIVPIMWIVFTEAISKQRSRGFWSSHCPRMVMVTMLSLSMKM